MFKLGIEGIREPSNRLIFNFKHYKRQFQEENEKVNSENGKLAHTWGNTGTVMCFLEAKYSIPIRLPSSQRACLQCVDLGKQENDFHS